MKMTDHENILHGEPEALKRLGQEVFLEIPLFRAKKKHRAIYINKSLFLDLFACKEKLPWDRMAEIIESLFNVTIEPERGTGEKIGKAYVDRQADPLDLSLSGNLGSGRAYYVGRYFNIKGEKTPLAISEKEKHSDGMMEMERCIWETLIAESLQGSIRNGLSRVLAILDMDEQCQVSWRDQPVRRGKIIRVDKDGSLDRTTHYFYNKNPIHGNTLEECSERFGTLEADKFIERIVHGNWSPGNISLKGHLIDFDTVCAMKGRSPQYSSIEWFYHTHFGFEFHGQANVLKALADDPDLNIDKIKFDHLNKTLMSSLHKNIAQRLPFLMGFVRHAEIGKKYKDELRRLTNLFEELALKIYPIDPGFSLKHPLSSWLHVFDFSLFFRSYPTLQRAGMFSPEESLSMICDVNFQENPFEYTHERELSAFQKPFWEKVREIISPCFVRSEGELNLLKLACLKFIRDYDSLFQKILKAEKEDKHQIEARAYVLNEDRLYLFPVFTLSYALAENKDDFSPETLNGMISALILSGQRTLEKEEEKLVADVRLYKEGYTLGLLDGKGHYQTVFSYYVENKRIFSDFQPLENMVQNFSRNPDFLVENMEILCDKLSIKCPSPSGWVDFRARKMQEISNWLKERGHGADTAA